MRWEGRDTSGNVQDARGGGFGGGLPVGGRGLSLGGVAVALVAGWIFGINPLTLLGLMDGGGGAAGPVATHAPPADDRQAQFVSVVLRDTEKVWSDAFAAGGQAYQAPKLTLFEGRLPTACGTGLAAMGPFYCPGDRTVYIDLGFFRTLGERLGAPGDFAQAYVIAHEVGHHVQHLLGTTGKVDAMRRRQSEAQANAMSVRLELQADCYAGLWARRSEQASPWLEQGDIEEGLNAASRIGDDTLQRQSQGTVVPESFTHGSSAQRAAWFRRGLEGDGLQACDTFSAARL